MTVHKTSAIIVSVLITALVAGVGSYLLWGQQASRLEQNVKALESANSALQEQIETLQGQIGTTPGENGDNGTGIFRAPRQGWEEYFPDPDSTTLEGEPVERVRSLMGEPPVLLRSIAANPVYNREIWIYMPYEEDPTGLYIYFKGNRVIGSRLDEFNGLYNSGLLDDEDFWVR
jgi:type II secretory pathway pseudopilin PulG